MGRLDTSRRQAYTLLPLSAICLFCFVGVSPLFAIEFTTDTTISSSQYNGEDIIVTGCTLTIDCSTGRGDYRSLLIRGNGHVTHPPGSVNGLWLAFSHDVTIDGWCSINVVGRGFPREDGPAPGVEGAGGTHGGTGMGNLWPVYDDIRAPVAFGSGGGGVGGAPTGAAGGGSVRLEVGGTVTLNGSIVADGGDWIGDGGAGAGGSIFITCSTLAGSGTIWARGGSGDLTSNASGGGGGGRIAIVANTVTHRGGVSAQGGAGRLGATTSRGGPGTIYYSVSGQAPYLLYANDDLNGFTRQPALDMPDTDLDIANARVEFDCSNNPVSVRSMRVRSNSQVHHPSGSEAGLHVVTVADMSIDGWCYLNVAGRGYGPKQGPGGGGTQGEGGTHGGTGQGSGMSVHDAITAPELLGSGGGDFGASGNGAAGGGRVRLEVGGTLTVGGSINADGGSWTSGNGGGGAGGSIYITCGTIAGAGTILARGGAGNTGSDWAGGGGGGRIAIIADSSSFSGSTEASGAVGRYAGFNWRGGPGTIYRRIGTSAPYLLFDNKSTDGVTLQPAVNMPDTDLDIANARVEFDCSNNPVSVRSMRVRSNSQVHHPSGSEAGLHVVTVADMSIDGWCYLNVAGRGYGPKQGPGGGGTQGEGGTHGGTGQGSGMPVHDAITAPELLGSGGGDYGASGNGAAGGGRVRLEVGGTLTVGGSINADGGSWASGNGGGGAGGSIYITCGTIAGAGSILARGGAGNTGSDWAGGGGGGRIAIIADSSSFSGSTEASGAVGRYAGFNWRGGPGTIYRRIGTSAPYLLFDNKSTDGITLQPAMNMPDTDLDIANARVEFDCSGGPISVRSLHLRSNSRVFHASALTQGLNVVTALDVVIDGWCGIDVSGRGYPAGQGPGAGDALQGGAYGGQGGRGNTRTYGRADLPLWLGSGGGYSEAAQPGAGGGYVRILAGGSITVNGEILADGSGTGGTGGSGGTILLVASSVTGGGAIRARGGGGTGPYGGGGGGRIASYVPAGAQALPSSVSVAGGGGAYPGTAGTIFTGIRPGDGIDLQFGPEPAFEWLDDGTGRAVLEVRNMGTRDSPGFMVEMFDRDPSLDGAVLLASFPVARLDAFDATTVELRTTDSVMVDTVWFVLDRANNIPELEESNNVLTMDVPRTDTRLFTLDRSGTITEKVIFRAYLSERVTGAKIPGRRIDFRLDGTLIGSGVTNADGRADLEWTVTEGPRTRTILAVFPGDATYDPASATATLTAIKWATKMASFDRTQRITGRTELKARLVRSDNTPIFNKRINFYVDGTFIIDRPTNMEGYASYPYYDVPDGAGAGVRTIFSEWPGDGGYLPISKTATLTVLKAIPYIWVMPRSVPQGGVYRLYCYFRRLYDYTKQEGKTLAFSIDGTFIADVVTGTVESGEPGIARYNFSTSGMATGDYTVRCDWAGDAWVDAGYGEARLTVY